jgi:hypothetical protein
VRPTTKKGALLFDEINRLLLQELAGKRATSATVAEAIKVVMRVMRPYLRNRFALVDTSDALDRTRGVLRVRIIDYAERRVASPDDLVIAHQELQPCPS